MLSSYFVASFFLAGLSVAHPQPNSAVPRTTKAAAPDSAHTSFISPTGTIASYNSQISSIARLSERADPPDNERDWDDVANTGIMHIVPGIDVILSHIFGDDETRTEIITVTVPDEPEKTSVPENPVTTTVTQEPDDPVTITVTQKPETSTSTSEEQVTVTVTQKPETSTTTSQEPGTTTITKEPEDPVTTTITQEPEEPVTTTVTQEPEEPVTTTVTQEPEDPVTTTVTKEPDEPVTTTITKEPATTTTADESLTTTTTTVGSPTSPTKTETETEPKPSTGWCAVGNPDGSVGLVECTCGMSNARC